MVGILWVGTGNALDSIIFDATVQETHSSDSEPTAHPVESGSSVVDNVVQKPETLKIECVVSDTPVNGAEIDGRADETWATLRRLKESAALLTIETPRRQYERMVLKSLDVPIDAKSGSALRFSAVFQQVRVAETQRVALRKPVGAREDKGKQAAKKAEAATEKKSVTLYKRFSQWLTGG